MLAPGADGDDALGCEDPTVVQTDGDYVVFYTGVDRDKNAHLLYATGADMRALQKRGVALPDTKGEKNSKEATLLRDGDGWRLLYEYSRDKRSRIGLAHGGGLNGPWSEQPDPFEARPDKWDSWHLSTGPLLRSHPERPVMFYNGADEGADWGIGWVALSPDLKRVVDRCDGSLIAPPAEADGSRDISFAASVIETDGIIWLYYSRNNRELKRATIRRR